MKHNVLYSFRRCPYAIRARWALLNTNQIIELREIDLKKKPKELIDVSSKATVPVLITKANEVIDESIDIMIWGIKRANMDVLLGTNKNDDVKQISSLIDTNDKVFKYHLDRYKYASRFNMKDASSHEYAAMEILLSLNDRLKGFSNQEKPLFLVNARETLADWAIWPFVRQFRIADIEKFDQNHEIKFLRSWLNYFFSNKQFQLVMKKNKPWTQQSEPIIFGEKSPESLELF